LTYAESRSILYSSSKKTNLNKTTERNKMKTTFKRDVQSVINLQKRIANQLVASTPPGEDFVVGMAIVARAYNVSLEHAHRVADSLFRKNTFNRHKNRYFTSCVSGLYSAVCCAQGQNLYEVQ